MTKNEAKRTIVRSVVTIAGAVAGYSVTKAVIKNNVAEPTTLPQKVTLAVGSFLIADLVSGATARHAGKYFDQIFEIPDQFKDISTPNE